MFDFSTIEVRYGALLDVLGRPCTTDGVCFVPAAVRIAGTVFSPEFKLVEWCEKTNTSLPSIACGQDNAPWVLGRLISLFQTVNTPEQERAEKTCFEASFVALPIAESPVAIPFTSSDYYGSTRLYFSSDDMPPEESKRRIADAFYCLLLEHPNEIEDCENCIFHCGAGEWFSFGVQLGQPYLDPLID